MEESTKIGLRLLAPVAAVLVASLLVDDLEKHNKRKYPKRIRTCCDDY